MFKIKMADRDCRVADNKRSGKQLKMGTIRNGVFNNPDIFIVKEYIMDLELGHKH
jgi:hypothetical protein